MNAFGPLDFEDIPRAMEDTQRELDAVFSKLLNESSTPEDLREAEQVVQRAQKRLDASKALTNMMREVARND